MWGGCSSRTEPLRSLSEEAVKRPVLRTCPAGEGDSSLGTHLPPHNGHEFTQGFEREVSFKVKNTNFCSASSTAILSINSHVLLNLLAVPAQK